MPVMLDVDPVKIAWDALSKDFPIDVDASANILGTCARCGTVGDSIPISSIVSPNFTDWELFQSGRSVLCLECAWAFKMPQFRTSSILLDKAANTACLLSPVQVKEKLLRPLGLEEALTVPISGRKHLLVKAKWGEVATDDGGVVWSEGAAVMLSEVTKLREGGVTTKALLYDYPPCNMFNEHFDMRDFLSLWASVKKWRGTPYFSIALKISQEKKDKFENE